VWLPGTWTNRLEDLITSPARFIDELRENIKQANDILHDAPPHHVLDSVVSQYAPGDSEGAESSAEQIDQAIETALEQEEWTVRSYPLFQLQHEKDFVLVRLGFSPTTVARLMLESLAAASRIAEIAKAAYTNGAQIRWFQYGADSRIPPASGDVIRGVNCGEILRMPCGTLSALRYLALSVANEQSLVFQTRRVGIPGVLFTADSDLRFGAPIDWGQPMIVTAPHHGSEANAQAYQRFEREGLSTTGAKTWVRSDGRFRSRPGASYVRMQPRFCTRCRGQGGIPNALEFHTNRGAWKKGAMPSCVCTPAL
jgi:hypothetical protein